MKLKIRVKNPSGLEAWMDAEEVMNNVYLDGYDLDEMRTRRDNALAQELDRTRKDLEAAHRGWTTASMATGTMRQERDELEQKNKQLQAELDAGMALNQRIAKQFSDAANALDKANKDVAQLTESVSFLRSDNERLYQELKQCDAVIQKLHKIINDTIADMQYKLDALY